VQADELDGLEREELEARLDEARQQLDEAAARLGELHSRLYALETVGRPGQRPMLGVLLAGTGPSGGLEIAGVTPGGGADQAGLRAGDELTSVNSLDISRGGANPMQVLSEALRDVEPGEDVSVGYLRDGSFAQVSVATHARGAYLMGIGGMPDVDIELDQVVAMEGMAEAVTLADPGGDLTAFEDIVIMDGRPPPVGRMSAQAIRIGGTLRLEDVDAELAEYFGVARGVLVLSVPESMAGSAEALKGGDILVAAGGLAIDSAGAAYQKLYGSNADGVTVEVIRQGGTRTIELDPRMLPGAQHRAISIHRSMGDRPAAVDVRVIRSDSP
jgi:predicted metalloprotease with PDZ domain